MRELLELIENNPKYTAQKLATMLNMDVEKVEEAIKKLEKDRVILSYKTLINWDKTDAEKVTAFIELKVRPQFEQGFDAIAEEIYKYEQVKTVWLMSGGFDLGLIVEGKTMKEVALFVAEKLAPLDTVLSTGTHFVLKTYKDCGVIFDKKFGDERGYVSL